MTTEAELQAIIKAEKLRALTRAGIGSLVRKVLAEREG